MNLWLKPRSWGYKVMRRGQADLSVTTWPSGSKCNNLLPGIRWILISIDGEENVGKWLFSRKKSLCSTIWIFELVVLSQLGTWPFVTIKIVLSQGAYLSNDRIAYFNWFISWNLLKISCQYNFKIEFWTNLGSISLAFSGTCSCKIFRNFGSVPLTQVMTRSIGFSDVRHFVLGSGGSGTITFPPRKRLTTFVRIVLSFWWVTDTAVRYS